MSAEKTQADFDKAFELAVDRLDTLRDLQHSVLAGNKVPEAEIGRAMRKAMYSIISLQHPLGKERDDVTNLGAELIRESEQLAVDAISRARSKRSFFGAIFGFGRN